MRKILKLLPLALALAACSSMKADDDFERYGNFLPSDFNLAKFSLVNPDIAALQVTDTVKQINAAWENSLKEASKTTAEINTLKKADSTEFVNGAGQILAINYLKWREEDINAALSETRSNDTTARGRWLRFNIYGNEDEPAFLANFLQSSVDSALILQTYVMYARKDGRPYRECRPDELGNEVKNKDMAGVIEIRSGVYNYGEIFFCNDSENGVVRRVIN